MTYRFIFFLTFIIYTTLFKNAFKGLSTFDTFHAIKSNPKPPILKFKRHPVVY